MMSTDSNQSESWAPCERGELRSFGRRARERRRLRGLTRVGGATAILLCVVGLGVWSLSQPVPFSEYDFGGIVCQEVRVNLKNYADGTLPDDLAKRIEAHLSECPSCQQLWGRMARGDTPAESSYVTTCGCPSCREQVVLSASKVANVPTKVGPTDRILINGSTGTTGLVDIRVRSWFEWTRLVMQRSVMAASLSGS